MTEEWKNRMYNYEVIPPEKAWEKIATALDDSHISDQFPSVLHDLAVSPPATAWDKIAASLDENVPSIPRYKRIPAFIRYAAAAVLVAGVAFGSIRLFQANKTNKQEPLPVAKIDKATDKQVLDPQKVQDLQDNLALEESKQTLASIDISPATKKKLVTYHNFTRPVTADIETFSFAPQNTYRELDHADITEPVQAVYTDNNIANRYIMLMTPDGQIIRMSKKLGDLVCCVSGEEQDDDCKDQLYKWRSKIASSPSHSPGNFLDILNLVNSLQSGNNH
jgi:hypothetical protein